MIYFPSAYFFHLHHQITSALNLSSLGIYIFLSLNINLSFTLHFLSLSIFTLAYFISSIALTTLSSFAFDFLIFSSRFTPSITTSTNYVAFTSNHFFLSNTLFSLSLFTPIYQSEYLLRLLALSILFPSICLSIRLNLDRYNVYFAYL